MFSKSLIFFLVSGMLLGAAYMLWLYQRVFFGEVTNPHLEEHCKDKDMTGREIGYMAPLLILSLWIGLYPKPVMDRMDRSVSWLMGRLQPVVTRVEQEKGYKPLQKLVPRPATAKSRPSRSTR